MASDDDTAALYALTPLDGRYAGRVSKIRDYFSEAALIKAKFSQAEYDENTWSTRTWLSFAVQQVSVALHKAVAREIEQELGGARERGCKVGGVKGGVAGSE